MVNAKVRVLIQCLSTAIMNANIPGFFRGRIYTGTSKRLCLPVLNCYSCPGALGACPIGSLQSSAGSARFGISFYVLGFLGLIGILLGRFVCGFVCPFGLLQDLIYKLPVPKRKLPMKVDWPLRFFKYAVLAALVLLMPLLAADSFGATTPYFCKYVCPAGMLEGGIPLIAMNRSLRGAIGWLFTWKMLVLVLTLLTCTAIKRAFCKYLCPLGAFYGLFNRLSFYRYGVACHQCKNCGACAKVCDMNINPAKQPNHAECIRCGACISACPTGAIQLECLTKKTEGRDDA